ncbi:hypothetical protein SAMN05428970_2017 [Agromyces sp. CF514]|uniref:hypothetical protein n=1 Tax=Agromyces sp. CF514 TaxID=1881031 RepID=UPI0008DF4FA7|nr:hypothetical protein [Agromyces sp. CF514]SFR76114.1 hypothetical protein SAMN05428970_2017 [Agromyces sp. CF514]
MSFKDDLAAAKAAVAPAKSPVIEVAVHGKLHQVVFYRASSVDWSHAAMKHLPRMDVALDRKNGYDLAGVSREISAKYGRVLEGDVETQMPAEDWVDFWTVIAPASARDIEASVWHLHEFDAEREIEDAKKASKRRPVSRKKSG